MSPLVLLTRLDHIILNEWIGRPSIQRKIRPAFGTECPCIVEKPEKDG